MSTTPFSFDDRKALLVWFHRHRRKLPWRKKRTGYRVWISEIMLQQTQVNTVIDYYQRWMNRFPDLPTLSRSRESTVLKMWEGMGYYGRARNILKTAKIVVRDHRGVFPRNHETLLSLPGIGPYTAGAIASLVYGQRRAILDGNVERVLTRVFRITDPVDRQENQKKLWSLAESLLPPDNPGTFNEAMMELGAMVCTPGPPDCPLCPLKGTCLSYRAGDPETLPAGRKSPSPLSKYVSAFVIRYQDYFLLNRRPEIGLMAGLWEFPCLEHKSRREMRAFIRAGKLRRWGLSCSFEEKWFGFSHFYTRYKIYVEVFLIEIPRKRKTTSSWVNRRAFAFLPLSSANTRIARALGIPLRP